MDGQEVVAILDAGSQYGKVIDRKVRELNVESEIIPFDTPVETIIEKNYKAIIISGGPSSVNQPNAPPYDPKLFTDLSQRNIPILGICYGMQLMAYACGGNVVKANCREDGQTIIEVDQTSPIFVHLDSPKQKVLLTHGDFVISVPEDFKVTSTVVSGASKGSIAAIESKKRGLYGLQFHPEVHLSDSGKQMLKNFLYGVAGLHGLYKMEDRVQIAVKYIQERVKDDKVLVLCSGGVDSTVCAALVCKVLGPHQVHALHINNGFMRKDESEKVKAALGKIGLNLTVIDASKEFMEATTTIQGHQTLPLKDTFNPEEKRKIIGDTFMKITEKETQRLGLDPNHVFIAQGTLRPDLIESASGLASKNASTIKTHHNDTELVRTLRAKGRIIEPLKDYHKDEVRDLGASLGLPADLIWRQPFPGPGLAIRILCSEKPFMDDSFRSTEDTLKAILNKTVSFQVASPHLLAEIENVDLSSISVTLLPIQSVGVQGDARTYSYVAALSGERDWSKLFTLAKIIPQVCHNINRVVYMFGPRLDKRITEITPTQLTKDVVHQLQLADDIVNRALFEHDLLVKLSQVPVILLPVPIDTPGSRSIVIRTFITSDFMTGVPAEPNVDIKEELILQMVEEILKNVPGISRVMYDMTSKPPGTTEWE